MQRLLWFSCLKWHATVCCIINSPMANTWLPRFPPPLSKAKTLLYTFFFLPLHIDEVIDSLSLLSSKIITETKKKIKITKAKVCAQNAARSYEYRSAVLWQHISWSTSSGQHPRPRGAIERGTYAKLIHFRFSSPRFGLVCYGTVCGMQFLRLLA